MKFVFGFLIILIGKIGVAQIPTTDSLRRFMGNYTRLPATRVLTNLEFKKIKEQSCRQCDSLNNSYILYLCVELPAEEERREILRRREEYFKNRKP